jgi:hypothetical protein
MAVRVIEGHGEHRAAFGLYPEFNVPSGVQIVIYQGRGAGMDDSHGITIGQGGALPNRLPTLWDAHSGEYDTEPARSGGMVRNTTKGVWIYHAGDPCPDYTLLAPNEPGYPQIVVQAGSYCMKPGNTMSLRQIADQHKDTNTQLRWACCTVLR